MVAQSIGIEMLGPGRETNFKILIRTKTQKLLFKGLGHAKLWFLCSKSIHEPVLVMFTFTLFYLLPGGNFSGKATFWPKNDFLKTKASTGLFFINLKAFTFRY